MEAKQTSLIELLEAVPVDARLVVDDGPHSTSFHPVGRLCHEAAAALRERLAQKEQKHEAWCASLTQLLLINPPKPAPCNCKTKITEPQPRQRQELSTEEIYAQTDAEMLEFARVLEARLKEKK